MTEGSAGGAAHGSAGAAAEPEPQIAAAKAALRRALRQTRAQADADPALRAALARQACAAVDRLARGRCLAGYMPLPTEADPRPAMDAHVGALCLPVVVGADRALVFRPWRPGEALVRGLFGTLEPPAGPPCLPDVLLVPLLGFDADGGRLGMGGGQYDRTLAALRAARQPTAPPLLALGLGYEAQRCAPLPRGPHDALLDGIVTETGLHLPGKDA